MSNLLALLKRLAKNCINEDSIYKVYFCPECCTEFPGHATYCELKAQIDKLEAEYEAKGKRWSYTSVQVLPFLYGFPYDDIAKSYIRALRPSKVRVSEGSLKSNACTWRVTVMLDPATKKIVDIFQEVEVDLPEGINNGWELDCALEKRTKEGE